MLKRLLTMMVLIIISIICAVKDASGQSSKKIFFDDFNGTKMSNLMWHIPTWVSPTDGTYVGRTQFRCSQNAALPSAVNSQAFVNLDTYNPTGSSIYGTDVITNKSFSPGKGLIFTIRAKIDNPVPGIVGGIYLYELTVPGARGWSSATSSADGVKLATVVSGGSIWTSTNSGITWTEQNMTGPYNWQGICSSTDGTKLAAIVSNGHIWTSTNSGKNWSEQTSPGLNLWNSISSSADGTKLAATSLRGYIWTSNDSGLTWKSHAEAGARNWYGITSSTDGVKLAAIVYSGNIWTSNDSGSTWTEQTNAGINSWNSIASSTDGTKLATTSMGGGIWTSTNSGITWTNQTDVNSLYWKSIASSSDGTKLVASYYNGEVWTSINSGVTWIKQANINLGSQNSIVSSSDGTKLISVIYGGNIWTSTNSGSSWTSQSGSNGSNHDEIDFELLTNDVNKIHTNIYLNEPMGVGRPDSTKVSNPISEFHTYQIKWLPNSVTWLVDGNIVRTENKSPVGPMRFNLNMWAPGTEWPAAYNKSLQYTTDITANKIYSMIVDSVRIDSLIDVVLLSSDAKLSSLTISKGSLNPSFNSTVLNYTNNVDNSISDITVIPTVNEINAKVKVNSVSVLSGSSSNLIPLNVGDNLINVTVTAQDGTTVKTYSIVVTRAAPPLSSDATLKNIVINQGTLSPTFSPLIISYTAKVDNDVSNFLVASTINEANATIKVNDVSTVNGLFSSPIYIKVGDNLINVTVTAQDGTTVKTYSIVVTRAAPPLSSDATLSNLSISSGIFSPTFSSSVFSYYSKVENNINSLTIIPTVNEANAKVKVNGTLVSSGSSSNSISLNVGDNVINVVVTAQDGTSFKTYGISVTRAAPPLSSDATLSNLVVTQGTLYPVFISSTIIYSDLINNDVSYITVIPTASEINAKIKVNGVSIISGSSTTPMFMNIGDNTIAIEVTAQNTTTKTYYVVVTRAAPPLSNDATLSNLLISNGILSPMFSSSGINYTNKVEGSISGLTITPTANQADAKITVNGESVISGSSSNSISLKVGENIITTMVTAQDKLTTKTYTVVVKRDTPVLINEQPQNALFFFPNPAHDNIYFSNQGDIDISIYNISGSLLLKKKIDNNILPINNLAPGLYLIKYEQKNIVYTNKLTVN